MTTRVVTRSSTLILALAAAGILTGLWLGAAATAAEAEGPLVVKIHADWCGTCTRMQPSWDRVSASLGGVARFVVLDVSDADTVEQARAEADRLGIRSFFDAHKSKTGTVGILDAGGDPVLVFKGELDAGRVQSAIEQARREKGA